MTTKGVLRHIADLLSVTEDDLHKALCFRVVAAGGDVVNKGHTEKEAVFAKDAFAKVSPCPMRYPLNARLSVHVNMMFIICNLSKQIVLYRWGLFLVICK